MLAINIDDAVSGVTIENRALPSLAQAAASLAMSAMFIYMLYQALPKLLSGDSTWMQPLDQLPDAWKTTIIAICLVLALTIAMTPLALSVRTLFFAKIWYFDALGRIVTRNGEQVAQLEECREIVLEGDFRNDTDVIDLLLLMKDDRKILLARGTASADQHARFLEAAKAISNRVRIPYRKQTLGGWFSKNPAWWTAHT